MPNFNEHAIYIICHCDADGYASAMAIKHKYPNAIILVANYGRPFPIEKVPEGSTLFVVDFAYKIHVMQELDQRYHLIWIDHHSHAIEDAEEKGFNPMGLRSIDNAACVLTWKFIFPEKDVPWSYQLIDDYDRWIFYHGESLPFHYGLDMMDIFPSDRNEETWQKIVNCDNEFMDNTLTNGLAIHEYITARDKTVMKDIAFDVQLGCNIDGKSINYNCCVANIRGVNSKFFDAHPKQKDYDAFMIYGYIPSLDQYRFSIYSNDVPRVDAGLIAQKQGNGGGHVGAAGFLQDLLVIYPPVAEDGEDSYVDHLEHVALMAYRSPLIKRYMSKSDRISMRSQIYFQQFFTWSAVLVNCPYTWPDIWYNISTDNAQIGVAYAMTNRGNYRGVITNLGNAKMEEVAQRVNGRIMPNGSVWFYFNKEREDLVAKGPF